MNNFYNSNNIIKKLKKLPQDGERFAYHISDKGLVSKMHKDLLNPNNKMTDKTIKNRQNI